MMNRSLLLALALALAAPAFGDTYSWLDDKGTMHFTEDLSRVPKKYRKKMRVQSDLSPSAEETSPQTGDGRMSSSGTPLRSAGSSGGATSIEPGSRRLYGGKSEEVWRNDIGRYETELLRLEGSLTQLKQQITAPSGLSREQVAALTKEYNENRAAYNRTYAEYSDLLDAARKAGLSVEMKR